MDRRAPRPSALSGGAVGVARSCARSSRGSPLALALAGLGLSSCVALNGDWIAPESTVDGESASTGAGSSASASDSSTTTASASTGDGSASETTGVDATSVGVGSSGETTGVDDTGCLPLETELFIAPPDIMFVLDKSAAMGSRSYPESEQMMAGQMNHWQSVREAVIDRASKLEDFASMGVVFAPVIGAPGDGAGACLVSIEPEVPLMTPVAATLESALPYPQGMSGARALGDAVATARDELADAVGEGLQYMVLITDGAPNCDPDFEGAELFDNYNPQAWIEIDDARAEGVFTMVVGLGIEMQAAFQQGDIEPDVDPWSTLNELALAGGMVGVDDDPKFKAAYTHAGLLKELALVDDLTFCVGRLPPALAELTVDEFDASVEVTIDGVVFPPISDCGTDDGYTVRQSDDGATIVACGAACALMKVGAHMHFSAECI